MLNKTLTALLVNKSSKGASQNPLTFAKEHNGTLSMKQHQGVYYMAFSSASGVSAHAWGASISEAYQNMLKNLQEKTQWIAYHQKNIA